MSQGHVKRSRGLQLQAKRTCILSSPVDSSMTIVLICSSTSDKICAFGHCGLSVCSDGARHVLVTHLVQVRVVCVQDTRELAVAAQLDVHALAERQLDEIELLGDASVVQCQSLARIILHAACRRRCVG